MTKAIEEGIVEEEMIEETMENIVVEKKEVKIEDLPGVGPATLDKLEKAGYTSLMSIAVASTANLVDASGLTDSAARKLLQAARDSLDMGFQSGEDILKKRAKVIKLQVPAKSFNELLDGGFETGAIVEVFGQYGSGKCTSKDTPILYFNPSTPHIQTMEEAYNKYKDKFGEKAHDEGFIVETPPVKVLGLTDKGLEKTQAKYIYKEHVKKLYEVKTKRGRTIRVTGPHKLLSFNEGMKWTPTATLSKGDVLAYPKHLKFDGESSLSEDDAYFLGLFAAEGSSNPLSISTGSEIIRDWLKGYIKERFQYDPTIRVDTRREDPCYGILLRKNTKELLGDLSKSNAFSKYVPEEVVGGEEPIIRSFLAGYIDGEGCFSGDMMTATTRSKELSTSLTYALLRIGISSTTRVRQVESKDNYVVSVSGKDKELLNELPLKIKTSNLKSKNSSYGYNSCISSYIREVYKNTLGGNRGQIRKKLGKKSHGKDIFYDYLSSENSKDRVMNEKTMEKIRHVFVEGLEDLQKATEMTQNIDNLNDEEFKELHSLLPFPFNSFHKELGLNSNTPGNYMKRGIPKDKVEDIQRIFLGELDKKSELLLDALKTLKNVVYFNWDEIEQVKEIEYNDFVYDFVVPEGHCFVGGVMPTMMHNTQIGHQLAVCCQLEGGKAVYIDTENTFRPERIQEMAKGAGLDPIEALRNIRVAKAYSSDHQMLLAEKVEELIKEDPSVRLVVVDSLTAHFRGEYVGRGTLAPRQQKLNKHMRVLAKIADMYNVCILVTNQVMAKPDQFFGDPTEAIGGHIVGHNSTFRIYLRKGKKGSRVAKLIDSPNLPDGECSYMVTQDGVVDL
jgi:DNA repair protein RadA